MSWFAGAPPSRFSGNVFALMVAQRRAGCSLPERRIGSPAVQILFTDPAAPIEYWSDRCGLTLVCGSYHDPAMKGDRLGQFSIRINQQWRICFRWSDEGPEDVEIVDYH